MHSVYICSPLGGNVSVNIENAKRYARYALAVSYTHLTLPTNREL